MIGSTRIMFLLFISSCFAFCKQKIKVDLIIHSATIYTADSNFSVKQAIAVKDGKIIATGNNGEVLANYEAKNMEDASGKFIFPGFIDAHCHFTGYATDLWKCDVTGTSSFEEVIERLKLYASTATTEWLYARGWDQNDWALKEFPDKKILDSLFPLKPVFLKRVDGHAALVNQKALEIAGLTASSKIEGGTAEVKNGKLTGIVIDKAMDIVENNIPLIADTLAQRYFLQTQDSCFQYGITGVHDCGVSEHTVDLVNETQQSGKMHMKIFALLTDSVHYYDRWINKGVFNTGLLHVGGFKVYADGALGSRGACLLKPYTDKPGWNGFLLSSKSYITSVAKKLAASGFQMCTHAIGDSAAREVLMIYGDALNGKNDRRWRMEHAQVIDEGDFHFFGQNSIVPSVQPTHATSDMYWAHERLGNERLPNAYAYKRLLQQNGWIALGTDFPVEDINPFKTFYAAVERKDNKGFPEGGFQKENALSRKEALLGMTIWAAKAAFEENEKGSLEAGKAADFFICDKDLLTTNAVDLLSTQVLKTFVDGINVFER